MSRAEYVSSMHHTSLGGAAAGVAVVGILLTLIRPGEPTQAEAAFAFHGPRPAVATTPTFDIAALALDTTTTETPLPPPPADLGTALVELSASGYEPVTALPDLGLLDIDGLIRATGDNEELRVPLTAFGFTRAYRRAYITPDGQAVVLLFVEEFAARAGAVDFREGFSSDLTQMGETLTSIPTNDGFLLESQLDDGTTYVAAIFSSGRNLFHFTVVGDQRAVVADDVLAIVHQQEVLA